MEKKLISAPPTSAVATTAEWERRLGSAARLVEPLDVDALAKEILDLLQNEDQRQLLSAAGPQQASKFSWEQTARLTLEVYRRVIAAPDKSQKRAARQS